MTALQWIVKEAKKIKKEYPKRFSKWTEYVAQASAIYAKKHKGHSPVGKKKKAKVGAVKNKAVKKATKKIEILGASKKLLEKIRAVKKKSIKKVAHKKSAAKSYHKDTKSHNVNIRVMSGIGSYDNPERILYEIEYWQKMLDKLRNEYKSDKGKMYKSSITADIRLSKKWLEVNKNKLKKVLSKMK